MTQTRFASMVESLTGVAIGYVIAVVSQVAIFPLFGIKVSITDNLLIGGYFTIISVARSFVIRRWFNRMRFGNVSRSN